MTRRPSDSVAGTAASIKGAARKLFSAEVVITDGTNATSAGIVTATGSTPPGTRGQAARADTLTVGITPNGNVKVKIQLPKLVQAGAGITDNAVPGFISGTIKGILQLTYL